MPNTPGTYRPYLAREEMASTTRSITWFVTGASRGIGVEIVRQLLRSPNNVVVAGCRTPEKATAPHALKDTAKGVLHIVQLDVADVNSIKASAKELEKILGDNGLDYLINNAGVAAVDDAFHLDADTLVNLFRVNAVGPAIVTQEVLPLLEKGKEKKILHISSEAGSNGAAAEQPVGGMFTAYSVSKAALNMFATKQSLQRRDFIVITLCPGPTKTDMSGEYGQLEPHESVSGLLKVITSATSEDSGKFYSRDGRVLKW
ncbi:NAD-P-binding protein [Trametes polyzona]|nr:NAD-P-binding protein [Trametes polyzona]